MAPDQVPTVSPLSESSTAVLRRLMAAANISSFRELCRRAEVSDWALQQLRRDRIASMRLETLQKLADTLQLSITAFLGAFGLVDLVDKAASAPAKTGDSTGRIAQLEQEYTRLQAQMTAQETTLRHQFQQEVLTILESWLLQWPTVVHAVEKNPDLPASRLVPLVQPLQVLLEQWQVIAIAPVGAEVAYNPQYHQLMTGAAQPGDPVKIRYAGFMQGETLLHRAKVSPVEIQASV